jgi:hypothetical protein
MAKEKLGDYAAKLFTHGDDIDLPHSEFPGTNGGFDTYGTHNLRSVYRRNFNRAFESLFTKLSNSNYFDLLKERLGVDISEGTKIVVMAKPYNERQKTIDVEVEPEKKYLFGLYTKPAVTRKETRNCRLSDFLKSYSEDEDISIVTWSVPYFAGWGRDNRGGGLFTVEYIIGKSRGEEISSLIDPDPDFLCRVGEETFPNLFRYLHKGIDYKKIPVFVIDPRDFDDWSADPLEKLVRVR